MTTNPDEMLNDVECLRYILAVMIRGYDGVDAPWFCRDDMVINHKNVNLKLHQIDPEKIPWLFEVQVEPSSKTGS